MVHPFHPIPPRLPPKLYLVPLATIVFAQPLPPNADRARTAVGLMYVTFLQFALLTGISVLKLILGESNFELTNYITIGEGILSFVQLILYLVTAIFFIMWFRRAYNNLFICGVQSLPYREGWAAGGWFVPIISLYYPYKIMLNIWFGTQSATRKTGERYEFEENANIGWWWAFWMIGSIVSNIHAQVALRGYFPLTQPGMIVMEFISDSSMCISAFLCWKMVKRMMILEDVLALRYKEWLAYTTQAEGEAFLQQSPNN